MIYFRSVFRITVVCSIILFAIVGIYKNNNCNKKRNDDNDWLPRKQGNWLVGVNGLRVPNNRISHPRRKMNFETLDCMKYFTIPSNSQLPPTFTHSQLFLTTKYQIRSCQRTPSTSIKSHTQQHTQQHSVALAGSLWPTLTKLCIRPEQIPLIIKNVKSVTEWQEIVIIPFVAFVFHPMVRWILSRKRQLGATDDNTNIFEKDKKNELSLYSISDRIGQIGQVALSVYVIDVLSVVLTTIGFQFPNKIQLSSSYTKIAYTALIISRILLYKKLALCKYFNVSPNSMGQVDIINRITNGIVVAIGALIVSDWLSIKAGFAMNGIFAFGSIGTLAFTLASQGLVTELISGLTLLFGNKMKVGDDVIFGDGISGKVLRIGWLESVFRGNDNIETTVPNALLSSQKVSNVSRIKISQVEQTLRFRYADARKLAKIICDIREEIVLACPKLITDPTIRPFRIYWTDYQQDHLKIMIDTHHRIEPDSDEYYENRQALLNAILEAVEKNNVELQYKL